jgi:hypothetical protein
LFDDAPPGSLIEVRWRIGSGMRRAFHGVGALEDVACAVARLANATDVYVGVLPRTRHGGRRSDVVPFAQALWADCDTPRAVAALLRFEPPPSMLVRSGTGKNRHAYWLLSESVSIDGLEDANRRIAQALGADVACAEAARILRPPSLNHKHQPPTRVRLESCDATARHSIGDVVRHLPVAVGAWNPRQSVRAQRIGDDPLLAIVPARYVETLTGIHVPRSGKVRCPFHQDDMPSLHVYRQPQHGWYCYGCRRGGSIYDFAALLWGCETRGASFLGVRARLLAAIGSDLAA